MGDAEAFKKPKKKPEQLAQLEPPKRSGPEPASAILEARPTRKAPTLGETTPEKWLREPSVQAVVKFGGKDYVIQSKEPIPGNDEARKKQLADMLNENASSLLAVRVLNPISGNYTDVDKGAFIKNYLKAFSTDPDSVEVKRPGLKKI